MLRQVDLLTIDNTYVLCILAGLEYLLCVTGNECEQRDTDNDYQGSAVFSD